MLIKEEQAKEAGWVGLEALHISIASAADELTVIWKKSHLRYSRTVSEEQQEQANFSHFFLLESQNTAFLSTLCCSSE